MLLIKSGTFNEGSIVNLLEAAQTADVRVHTGITSITYRTAAADIHAQVLGNPQGGRSQTGYLYVSCTALQIAPVVVSAAADVNRLLTDLSCINPHTAQAADGHNQLLGVQTIQVYVSSAADVHT